MFRSNFIELGMLEEIKKRLQNLYYPRFIYLFGSYAWGVPS